MRFCASPYISSNPTIQSPRPSFFPPFFLVPWYLKKKKDLPEAPLFSLFLHNSKIPTQKGNMVELADW
jgi:hypothetical protein